MAKQQQHETRSGRIKDRLRNDPSIRVAMAAVVVGIALIVCSALVGSANASWLQGLLVNLGSAVVLVAPFYWLTQRLEDRVEKKVETANDRITMLNRSVETVTNQVRTLRELAEEHERQREDRTTSLKDLFRELAEHPTRSSLYRAVDEAERLGLVDLVHTAGLRSPIHKNSNTYLALIRYFERDHLAFELQDISGAVLPETSSEEITWSADDTDGLQDFFPRVEDLLVRARDYGNFDPRHWFERISATLLVALEHPDARTVVELIGNQWALTDDRAIGIPGGYDIPFTRMPHDSRNPLAYAHIAAKQWVDNDLLERAYFVGQERLRLINNPVRVLPRAADESRWPESARTRRRTAGAEPPTAT